MKRITSLFAVVVALVVAVQVAGCGGAGQTGGAAADDPADTTPDTTGTTEPTPPSAPSNVSATAGNAQVTIGWDAVTGAVSYNLYWKNAAGVTTADAVLPEVTPPYVHAGLTNGTAYFYAVTALDANGESVLSLEVSATPQVPAPGVPQNLTVQGGYESTTVSWDAVAGAASYNLYWSTDAGVTPANGTKVAGAASPYIHAGLAGDTPYYYVVTAVGAGGEGEPSAEVSAKADYPQRRAFVTSAEGTGDLGSWADAGGETGLAAADAICAARAQAAGLSGTFVAWLSDENDDAYCRVHDGTGKKGACAGTTTDLGFAGPWIRMDGLPFADRIDVALAPTYKVLHPVLLDETGVADSTGYYFTNTNEEGRNASVLKPCNNWQSAAAGDSFMGGYKGATGSQWSEGFGGLCNMTISLLCLETGQGGSLPASNGSGKKVFVTSANGTGDLSTWADAIAAGKAGIDAGDAICAARASAAGLAGTFKAFLSTSTVDARDRLSDSAFVRLDGVTVAANKADLLDDLLTAPINYTETGTYLPGDNYALTGTYSGGTKAGAYCADWTDSTSTGAMGDVSMVNGTWARYGNLLCDLLPGLAYQVYCFED